MDIFRGPKNHSEEKQSFFSTLEQALMCTATCVPRTQSGWSGALHAQGQLRQAPASPSALFCNSAPPRVTAVFTVSPSGEELKGEGTAIPGVRKTVLTGPAAACEQGSTRFPPTSFDLGLVGVFCFFDLVINSFSIIQDETKGKNKEERKKTSHHIKGCWLHRSFFTLKY